MEVTRSSSGLLVATDPHSEANRRKRDEDRRADREAYYEAHCRCPQCGGKDFETTTMGPTIGDGDTNRAICGRCHWIGVVHDLREEGFVAQEVRVGQYVVELSDACEDVEPEILDRIQSCVNEALRTGKPIVLPRGCTMRRIDVSPSEIQMERLLSLLALTEQERAFVRTALEPDNAADFWGVLADYLEEKGVPNETLLRWRQHATEQETAQ